MAVKRSCWANPEALSAIDVAEFAQKVEDLGYSQLWLAEILGRDPFAQAAHLGAVTSTLGLASGIANVYNRRADAMKRAAYTVAEQTGSRFTLGLGVSSPVIVSKIRGIPYDKPLSYMRSYLDAMDAFEYISVLPRRPLPVVLAALGPRMLELAAERTDGAHTYNATPEHTAFARSVIGPDAKLCVEQKVMLTTDPDQARATCANVMKFYIRAPGYRNCWKSLGFRDDDIDNLSDRFVDAMVAWGDIDTIERRLAEHADAGTTEICIHVLHPTAGSAAIDYDALAALAP
ncbi:MAG: TIGR03620 family F420-dependent LLM class oxidoreductase [Acidimicrobiaceae bacterium]|nr:TIGR03620 family F420-dependent LLM class oxidoreductase [Acidimicrobiaceae bacterium]MYH95955.1 TIGR03620 family F420-dependent LLM class oxidoreductase [Acidimicrobiia bacterium]MCY3644132.1 TIGR03620 family F420-dependent LLM class oxidoreductase [Acidimicrobiaceae bacterium]MDE0664465.1 TIGR03620 family F420-dependent LLM class oxidoreductase [Acidimicrobiaceae bacterium]MXY09071.1 TIGR03620 family F420-dependent LLM class oxidoreductase [Acidimicrobiaceae bacterium]